MQAKTITKITYFPTLGGTPARVNRVTGEMQISLEHWKQLPPEHRFFIMLHELAHLVLQTRDEKAVDEWAFAEYAKRGYSLKQSVFALTKVLSFTNQEHYWRAYLQLERAREYDYYVNGNKKAYDNALCECDSPLCKKKHRTFKI